MTMVTMARIRRVCRRNIVLIVLVLAVIVITYYELTKTTDETPIKLPQLPKTLSKFLEDSQQGLKKSIDRLRRAEFPAAMLMNEFFKELNSDGFNLHWIHESDFHIPLQNETQSMVDLNSVMDNNGYIKTDTLDQFIKEGRHGIHLPMYSLGQAKVALAALSTRPHDIKAPVLISAKILQGPNIVRCRKEKSCAYSEPIVLDSFLKLLKQNLHAQLGLGWTDHFDANNVNQGYTWSMVIQMLELTREVRSDNYPVLIVVRAALARQSIAQLKWLSQVTGVEIVLEVGIEDVKFPYLPADIALVYNLLPKSSVYLRVPQKLRNEVEKFLKTFAMPQEWNQYKDRCYKDQDWTVMMLYDKKYFLRSDDAILMYPAGNHPIYLGSVNIYKLRPRKLSHINGRVLFFEDSENLKTGQFRSALKIFIDTEFESIGTTDTQILVGSNGYFSISSFSSKRDVLMNDHKLEKSNPCYHFHIEVEPRGVDLSLSSPVDCNFPLDQKFMETMKIRLDINLSTKPFKIFLEPVGNEPVLIDQFSVKE